MAIGRGERTAVCGMGGIGKSRLIMQLAMIPRAAPPPSPAPSRRIPPCNC